MLKYIYVVIILLLSGHSLFAQPALPKVKIKGNIVTTDEYPAEWITVSLKNTVYNTSSDSKGSFEFEAPAGEYIMEVYSIWGHRIEMPITVNAGVENTFADITIMENKTQLDEVVITGQYKPQSLRNSVYKVKVINAQKIEQKAATNVQALLNTEAGIRFENDMMLGESDLELMGMSGNNVKVLIDGVPIVDRDAKKQSLSQIDINNIERIEIVEGPMSVMYGTDALAGVINIITKKAVINPDKNVYSVSVRVQEETVGDEYSAFSGKGIHEENVNLNFAHKSGVYTNAGFTRNTTGGWVGDKTGREKLWQPKDQYLYNIGAGFKKGGFNVWYRLDFLDEKIFTPNNGTILEPHIISDRDYKTKRFTHMLQSDWKVSNRVSLNLTSSYQDYNRRTHSMVTDLNTGEKWLSIEESSQDKTLYKSAFARLTATWKLLPNLTLQPGVEYQWDKISGGRISGEPDMTNYSVFLSAEWKPTDWMSINPGVRTVFNSNTTRRLQFRQYKQNLH